MFYKAPNIKYLFESIGRLWTGDSCRLQPVCQLGARLSAEIPPKVKQGLLGDGIDVRGRRPPQVMRADLESASRIVTFGCDLGDLAPSGLALERWDDVPARRLRSPRVALKSSQVTGS